MKTEVNSDTATAVILVLIGVLFVFKPEVVGIIIGLFLILMGVNSLIKSQRGKSHGRRETS